MSPLLLMACSLFSASSAASVLLVSARAPTPELLLLHASPAPEVPVTEEWTTRHVSDQANRPRYENPQTWQPERMFHRTSFLHTLLCVFLAALLIACSWRSCVDRRAIERQRSKGLVVATPVFDSTVVTAPTTLAAKPTAEKETAGEMAA